MDKMQSPVDGDRPSPAHNKDSKTEPNLSTFGRFRNLSLIGQGGMAKVFHAFDSELGRSVALKFIRHADAQLEERFLMEAKAQARVVHENVCKVYEAGQIESRRYIAMQFIHGQTLNTLFDRLSVEQKTELIRKVAGGVHAAHRVGVIHRDLKPGNIMVEQTEDGRWIPYVLDFGLAREVAAAGMTVTGEAIGTPTYMSPEQVKGEVRKLDRRSDVYALGATFYELLCGRTPFEAESTVDLMLKIVNEDPIPIRHRLPGISTDLETIVMKCLEKDPVRRYDSAKAFAEDLGRYLDGDPISARPDSLMYRLKKKAQKNKSVFLAATVAIVISAVLGAFALQERLNTKRQALRAHQLGQQVKEVEGFMRIAALNPAHNILPEKNWVRSRIKDLEVEIKNSDSAGRGPARYAIARAYMTLSDYSRAHENLEQAWKSGYRQPEVAYALGLTLSNLYKLEREEAEHQKSDESRKARLLALQKQYLVPAIQYLAIGRGVYGDAPEYLDATLSFLKHDWDHAIGKCDAAVKKLPWLFEANRMKGDVHMAAGSEIRHTNTAEAVRQYQQAIRAYSAAAETGRSDPKSYIGMCNANFAILESKYLTTGEAVDIYMKEGMAACDQALYVDPEDSEAVVKKSRGFYLWSNYLMRQGKDPSDSLKQAQKYAQDAIEMGRQDAYSYNNLGIVHRTCASYEKIHGLDPRAHWKDAIDAFRRAIAANPNYGSVYNNLGNVNREFGDYEVEHGEDPQFHFQAAIASMEQALKINPTDTFARNNSGLIYWSLADNASARGRDPEPYWAAALRAFQKAAQLNPLDPYPLNNLCGVYDGQSLNQLEHGADPRPSIQKAVENCERTIAMNANWSFPRLNKAAALLVLARYQDLQNIDPTGTLQLALETLRRATELQNDSSDGYQETGRAYLLLAKWKKGRNLSYSHELSLARQNADRAIKIDPSSGPAYADRAQIELLQAELRQQGGGNAISALDAARADVERAIQINPRAAEAYWIAGEISSVHATDRSLTKAKRQAVISAGLEALDHALLLNPKFARAHLAKGLLLLQRNANESASSNASLKTAIQELELAFSINRNLISRNSATMERAKRLFAARS